MSENAANADYMFPSPSQIVQPNTAVSINSYYPGAPDGLRELLV